jgi:hypothetical protein
MENGTVTSVCLLQKNGNWKRQALVWFLQTENGSMFSLVGKQ